MSRTLRLLALLAIPGLLVAGWVWVGTAPVSSGTGSAQAGTRQGISTNNRQWVSAEQCRPCHQRQHDEWTGSHHQIAYTNPEVRKLSDDFRIKDCKACHLPRPVAQTGFEKRTLPRRTRPREGVGCLACHLDPSGGIMAPRDNPSAPCRPQANRDFASERLCASCHNQHQTTDQWRQSHYRARGETCNTCHMPGGSHAFPGAHDDEMLRAAATFEAWIDNGLLHLSLANTGAGHNFPTEERHRAVDLTYRMVPADPEASTTWQLAWRFRQPYRDEPGDNTQLPAGKTKVVPVTIPKGVVRIETRVWYRLRPHAPDSDSTLLFEKELAVR